MCAPSPRALMTDASAASEKSSPLELLAYRSSSSAAGVGVTSSTPAIPSHSALPELSRALLYAGDSLVYELALWPLGLPPRAADLTDANANANGIAAASASGTQVVKDRESCALAVAYAGSLVSSWDSEHSLRRSCGRRVFCELVWLNAASLSSHPLTRAPFFALSSGTSIFATRRSLDYTFAHQYRCSVN